MTNRIININFDELNSAIKLARSGDLSKGYSIFIIETNKLIEFTKKTTREIEQKIGRPIDYIF